MIYYMDLLLLIKKENIMQDGNEVFNNKLNSFKEEIKNIINQNYCPLSVNVSKVLGERIKFSEEYIELSRLKQGQLIKKCQNNEIIPIYFTNRSSPSSMKSFYKDRFNSLFKIEEKIKEISQKYKISGEIKVNMIKKYRKSFGLFKGHEDTIIEIERIYEKL